MSSIRNSVPARSYRERAQPLSREKRHGLLEKHKDYALRAKDHNAKKARLRLLRQKATDRNPDEFYFGMISSQTKNGVKVADRGNLALSQDVVKLLKTQDAGYLRTQLQMARKERERLEQEIFMEEKENEDGKEVKELVALRDPEAARSKKHMVFVESQAEQQGFDPDSSLGSRSTANGADSKEARAAAKQRNLRHKKLRTQLEAVKEREEQLTVAEQELEQQRATMAGATAGVNKNGTKFKPRERKR